MNNSRRAIKARRALFFRDRARHLDDMHAPIIVSDHAYRKLKARMGVGKGDAMKVIRRAWELHAQIPREWPIARVRYSTSPDPRKSGHRIVYRRYGKFAFIFDIDGQLRGRVATVLMTVRGPFNNHAAMIPQR